MAKNNGQCKSLPLYYLILLEALGGEAYLSFSPSHSFIKCKSESGELFNLELTNGMLTTDSWIVGSGYVKSEAIKSGIFLDTLNKRQVVANYLTDLAQYYKWKFGQPDVQQGYDGFNLKCINQTLKYHPGNIHAILKNPTYTSFLQYLIQKKGYTTQQQVLQDPETKMLLMQRSRLYALTDGLV